MRAPCPPTNSCVRMDAPDSQPAAASSTSDDQRKRAHLAPLHGTSNSRRCKRVETLADAGPAPRLCFGAGLCGVSDVASIRSGACAQPRAPGRVVQMPLQMHHIEAGRRVGGSRLGGICGAMGSRRACASQVSVETISWPSTNWRGPEYLNA